MFLRKGRWCVAKDFSSIAMEEAATLASILLFKDKLWISQSIYRQPSEFW